MIAWLTEPEYLLVHLSATFCFPGSRLMLMLLNPGCSLTVQKLKFEFSQNTTGYLKNHWTNTRLVCTHLNAFLMLNSNMVMTFGK